MKQDHKPSQFLEEKMVRLDNKIIDVEIMGLPMTINEEHCVEMFFRDITDRKKTQELIYQMAYHDPLTELPNRRFFEERLKEALTTCNQNLLSVMFLDLDRFKDVNDTLGHDIGDTLLQEVATRLKEYVEQKGVVARLAGDEFTILLSEVSNRDQAISLAKGIIKSIEKPFMIQSHEVKVTTSIGISFNLDHSGVKELIKHADMAMYQAKKKGKNSYHVYEDAE